MTPQEFKRIRSDLDLSQQEMADKLGIGSSRAIRYYESGQRPISGPVAVLMGMYEMGER